MAGTEKKDKKGKKSRNSGKGDENDEELKKNLTEDISTN